MNASNYVGARFSKGLSPKALRFNAGKPMLELIPLCLIKLILSYKNGNIKDWTEEPSIPLLVEYMAIQELKQVSISDIEYLIERSVGEYLQYCLLSKSDASEDIFNDKLKELLDILGHICSFGAHKYDRHNWKKGMLWSMPLGSACRHLSNHTFISSNNPATDEESNQLHIGHAIWNLGVLLDYIKNDIGINDLFIFNETQTEKMESTT